MNKEYIDKKELLKELRNFTKNYDYIDEVAIHDNKFFDDIIEAVISVVNSPPVDKKKITTY